jgi:hypothetical protein
MSRGTIVVIGILCGALAVLLFLPKSKKQPADGAATAAPAVTAASPDGTSRPAPGMAANQAARPTDTPPPLVNPPFSPTGTSRVTAVRGNASMTNLVADPEIKPLPVLVRDYLATTNRDTRLDIVMDITETSSAESVKALTRLFEAETDPELKVDLLDSLLGIDGFKDEKLAMLTLGIRQGLNGEVRQSAIDGLIDLEDPRVVPLLNGLLNDPDQEIRESAQDALDLVQTPPIQTPKTVVK